MSKRVVTLAGVRAARCSVTESFVFRCSSVVARGVDWDFYSMARENTYSLFLFLAFAVFIRAHLFSLFITVFLFATSSARCDHSLCIKRAIFLFLNILESFCVYTRTRNFWLLFSAFSACQFLLYGHGSFFFFCVCFKFIILMLIFRSYITFLEM